VQKAIRPATPDIGDGESSGPSWQECYDRYLEHQKARRRQRSVDDTTSRLGIAETILDGYVSDNDLPGGMLMHNIATLDAIEHLQDRLLAGDFSHFDERSPNTVNSVVRVAMAFLRFCFTRKWITAMPHVEKLDTDDVMKGRPITETEFQQMLDATEAVVGASAAASWKFALRILWGSAFRIGDLMDFSWNDPRHIHPVWGRSPDDHPTLAIPSSQKNGKTQEIPMLPELAELLRKIPEGQRTGWVATPEPVEFAFPGAEESFRPSSADLKQLSKKFRISAIAAACGVSVAAVRKWPQYEANSDQHKLPKELPAEVVARIRRNADRAPGEKLQRSSERLTKERVGRVISKIGVAAGIVVQVEDSRLTKRQKFASAHDIRRGVAQRLINHGVSAETLKVIMRHKNFATTERHYGAIRSAQKAAAEIAAKLSSTQNSAFVGGLVGGIKKAPQLNAEELEVLKSLLSKL
jgi:integrase